MATFREPKGTLSRQTLNRSLDKCGLWQGECQPTSLRDYFERRPPTRKYEDAGKFYLAWDNGEYVQVGVILYTYSTAPVV